MFRNNASLFPFFIRFPGMKANLRGSHVNVYCLLKNASFNRNKYILSIEIKNPDNVSLRDMFTNLITMYPLLKQNICKMKESYVVSKLTYLWAYQ